MALTSDISKLTSNDQVEVAVLPIVGEIGVWRGQFQVFPSHLSGEWSLHSCSYSLPTSQSSVSVRGDCLMDRGDRIRSAPCEILSADDVASTGWEVLSQLQGDVLSRSHVKNISLRQRSSAAHAELVSQLECHTCFQLSKFWFHHSY